MLSRILIANRGEIALRIIRACRELGVETVAVYSEADRDASYVHLADESVCIGPPDCNQSYLNIPRIISAAEITNVDAIHPGYGFLAENINFAEICRDCGIAFVGPPVEAMRLLGDKVEARKLAQKAKVPVVPGSEGTIQDEKEALKLASQIGYPVIIKAVAGGGGRGMRVVHNDISLRAALSAARAEAEVAFGDDSVYLEKFIVEPRHVEVQVLADAEGNVLHFYERDCSIQRRHQKMIEESPCPMLQERDRERLAEAAIRLIKEANYVNAATVEFLLDKDGKFYFIEVNTRIQVEHPVTEMVTGHDLIKLQIKVASGQRVKLRQKDIKHHGVAIECRINAEDPANNSGRQGRYPRASGVDHRPQLRLAHRQDHRPPEDAIRSDRHDASGVAGVLHRSGQDHHSRLPGDPLPQPVCQRQSRHGIRRAQLLDRAESSKPETARVPLLFRGN
jgi:acetyl-CoA carboxylase biotin carboxylase subunit